MTNQTIINPPPLPHQKMDTFRQVAVCVVGGVLLLGVLGAIGGGDSTHTSIKDAKDAAEVGDVVTVRYPASTIMCSVQNDAETVYIAGEQAMRQTYRLENHDTWKAIDAEKEAQKIAMRTAYSCQWAPSDSLHFVVKQKQSHGDESSLFYTADYCLKPEDRNGCWWIVATANMNAQIEKVTTAAAQSK